MESTEPIRSTVLLAEHLRLNARMVPFAGWNLPVQYGDGILAEHERTRTASSLFDVCHMGEFLVEGGRDVGEGLDPVFARPVADQPVGSCRYNLLLNDRGGVVDDLIVYRRREDAFLIVVNAGCVGADAARIRSLLPAGLVLRDVSAAVAKLDLQGPESREVLCRSLGLRPEGLPRYFHFVETGIEGVPALVSRTGYTGELGYELYVPAEAAAGLWRRILRHPRTGPAGLGARDTLRLEAGLPLYGHELTPDVTPLEAGMEGLLRLDRRPDRPFAGRDGMLAHPGHRRLCALYLEGRRSARQGTEVQDRAGRTVGRVTSGCFAPSLKHAIAFAYLERDLVPEDGEVVLPLGRASVRGHVGALPFYTNGTARG